MSLRSQGRGHDFEIVIAAEQSLGWNGGLRENEHKPI